MPRGPDDGFYIAWEDETWLVFYSEGGKRRDITTYESYEDACTQFLRCARLDNASGTPT